MQVDMWHICPACCTCGHCDAQSFMNAHVAHDNCTVRCRLSRLCTGRSQHVEQNIHHNGTMIRDIQTCGLINPRLARLQLLALSTGC